MKRMIPVLIASMAATAAAQAVPTRWTDPAGLPKPMNLGAGVAVGDDGSLFVAFGGSPEFQRYAPSTGTWTPLAPFPGLAGFHQHCSMARRPGTLQLYVVDSFTKGVYRYDLSQPAPGIWVDTGSDFPAFEIREGFAMTATEQALYAFGGMGDVAGGMRFYKWVPESGPTWTPMGDLPAEAQAREGSTLLYPGSGGFIYATPGGGRNLFWRYNLATESWQTDIGDLPWPGSTGSSSPRVTFSAGGSGRFFACIAGVLGTPEKEKTLFFSYDIAGNSWRTLATPPAFSSYAMQPAWPGSGDEILFFRGYSTVDLWRYSIAADRFQAGYPSLPRPSSNGAVAVADGSVYAIEGNGRLGFFRRAVSAVTWEELPSIPAEGVFDSTQPGAGASLVHDGGDFIYYMPGGGSRGLLRYSISGSGWDQSPATYPSYPGPNAGAGLVNGGDGNFYLVLGGNSKRFHRYNVSQNLWLQDTPDLPLTASSMTTIVHPGVGDHLYVIRGTIGTAAVWAYSITRRAWNVDGQGLPYDPADPALGPTENPAGTAGAMSSSGEIYLCTRVDFSTLRLWRYAVGDNSWEPLGTAPGSGHPLVAYAGSGRWIDILQNNLSTRCWGYLARLDPVDPPELVGQFRTDGIRQVPAGGVTPESGFKLRTNVSDPLMSAVQLEVELQPEGLPFSGQPTASTVPVPSGSSAGITFEGLAMDRGYRWQARTVIAGGMLASDWVPFGGGGADIVLHNEAPAASAAAQIRDASGRPIELGRSVLNGEAVRIEATVADATQDEVLVEIEIRPVGEPFTGVATATSSFALDGGRASAVLHLADGAYHWQLRAVDLQGGVSAWAPYGGNAEGEADFSLMPNGSTNSVAGCGQSAAGGIRGMAATISLLLFFARILCRRGGSGCRIARS